MRDRNKLTEIEKSLKEESSDRKKILKEVNNRLDSYTDQIIDYESKIKKYELMEIKYNNLERELEDKTKMYETIIADLKCQNEVTEKEISKIKKETVNLESKITALKSIVEVVIKSKGIDFVSKSSGFSEEQLKKYLQD